MFSPLDHMPTSPAPRSFMSLALPVLAAAPPLGDQVQAVLRRHPDAALRTVARELQVAARTLQRSLAHEGKPFQELRRVVRLELACRLLVEPGSKVDCVARDVGFASTPHFVTWFRRHHGTTPSAYRQAARTPLRA